MLIKNHEHNSGKDKKRRGVCKNVIKSRKQALRAMINKLHHTWWNFYLQLSSYLLL